MRVLLCLFALASAGCLRTTEFQCATDSACGASGRCEPNGFCSFTDTECDSGRRYDPSAGTLGGKCTSDGIVTDGGNGDTSNPPDDASLDAPPGSGCPSGYVELAGAPGHFYKLVTTAQQWSMQHQGCQLTTLAAYLAVPDTIEELTAMDTLAGAAPYWVGITDSANEMQWRTVLGGTQTFLPWQPPAPDDNAGGQGEDCVEALPATHTINDVRCNQTRPAICECNPP